MDTARVYVSGFIGSSTDEVRLSPPIQILYDADPVSGRFRKEAKLCVTIETAELRKERDHAEASREFFRDRLSEVIDALQFVLDDHRKRIHISQAPPDITPPRQE